jgi:predicted negative regulator of RcsB-dependent stress response
MATPLDLQEQEQLDELKAFWKTWGNLITWVLIAVFGAYAAWNGWNWYQRDQGLKAGAMFDELERATQAADVDKSVRVFNDLRQRYPGTAFAQQGGLAAAKLQVDKGQADAARATLQWVADSGSQDELKAVARLRLAGLLLDARKPEEALAQLSQVKGEAFQALVADRRGDALAAQGKLDEAKAAYQSAYKGMDERQVVRRLVEAKLTALGAAPEPAASAASAKTGGRP